MTNKFLQKNQLFYMFHDILGGKNCPLFGSNLHPNPIFRESKNDSLFSILWIFSKMTRMTNVIKKVFFLSWMLTPPSFLPRDGNGYFFYFDCIQRDLQGCLTSNSFKSHRKHWKNTITIVTLSKKCSSHMGLIRADLIMLLFITPSGSYKLH